MKIIFASFCLLHLTVQDNSIMIVLGKSHISLPFTYVWVLWSFKRPDLTNVFHSFNYILYTV